jgi:hypothetical protein
MARRAPRRAATVRSIRSSRSGVMTIRVTPSGTRSSSIRRRTVSKSVWEAAGKPTSISRKPQATRRAKNISLRSTFIGSNRAWLPSRRSVDSQTGAWVTWRAGHWRCGSSMAGKGRYLVAGWSIIVIPDSAEGLRA